MITHEGKEFRFASLPYIGTGYPAAKTKILFVGKDMGMDETYKKDNPDGAHIQGVEERRGSICDSSPNDLNPHMAGTYVTAMYLLKDEYDWNVAYQKIEATGKQFKQALAAVKNLPETVLSKVALTNYHKYVVAGRNDRSGGQGRVYALFYEKERYGTERLLIDEINILDPDNNEPILAVFIPWIGDPTLERFDNFNDENMEQYIPGFVYVLKSGF